MGYKYDNESYGSANGNNLQGAGFDHNFWPGPWRGRQSGNKWKI